MRQLNNDSGLVSAEFALTIPSFVILLLALLGSFQLGMERINNQQLAQSEAIRVSLGGETEYQKTRVEQMVCVTVSGTLEVLDAKACAPDYRFTRLGYSDDAGSNVFGN